MATQPAEVIDTPDIVEQADEQQSAPRDFEAEARAHGWTPQDEFKGDPSRWVDAETFVKRADEVMPLLKKKTQNQDREIADLKRQIKRLTRAEQAAYENALAEIKAKMADAAERGDTAAHAAALDKFEKLRDEAAAEVPEDRRQAGQEAYDSFREANLWYDKGALASASEVEVEARLYADRLADRYAAQGLTREMAPGDFFAKIADEVEERFPLLKAKKAARQKPPSAVEGVTTTSRNGNAKSFANLPPEAQRQCDRFHAQGIYGKMSIEDARKKYVSSYQW